MTFRENTEGMYSGLEVYDERRRMADGFNRISYDASYRLIDSAFKYAADNGRKKVTLVHKANILKRAGQIFLEAGEDLSLIHI